MQGAAAGESVLWNTLHTLTLSHHDICKAFNHALYSVSQLRGTNTEFQNQIKWWISECWDNIVCIYFKYTEEMWMCRAWKKTPYCSLAILRYSDFLPTCRYYPPPSCLSTHCTAHMLAWRMKIILAGFSKRNLFLSNFHVQRENRICW